jgi:hypothetical protein
MKSNGTHPHGEPSGPVETTTPIAPTSTISGERLAHPVSQQERQSNYDLLSLLHPGNRFRLMFGQPFLEGDPGLKEFRRLRGY